MVSLSHKLGDQAAGGPPIVVNPGGRSIQRRVLVFLLRVPSRVLVLLLLWLIRTYQRFISPGLRPCCRFVPSCSVYAAESLEKHGLFIGLGRALWRLARCHPFSKGGLDSP